jgi:hypothetical protein
MSIGLVASQMESMRIIAADLADKSRGPQLFRLVSSLLRNCTPLDHPFAFDLTNHVHSF